ncbi:MAG: DUF3540 domain-containing protein [Alcaligenaceae bacterium]|nr:DUF3540 domain-containing protein [Alcaligenaceae bacterium]
MSATLHTLPLKPAPTPACATHSLSTATITGVAGEQFLMDHPDFHQTQVAASCLLQPAPGDTVLITHAEHGAPCYILAVLQRPQQADSGRLRLPGGNQLASDSQGVRLQAGSITLNAAERLNLNSAEHNVNAVSSEMNVKHWQGRFDTIESHAINVQFTAKTLSTQVGRLIQRLLESFRKVKGVDETRAGRIRVHAEDHHHIQAGHLTHNAKGFVKIDGQKIDLG